LGWFSRFLVCVVLVVSPLLLGSNRALFWAFNGLVVALALGFFVASEFSREKRIGSNWIMPRYLLALYLLPIAVMLLQILPYIPYPLAHPAWNEVTGAVPRMTANPSATLLTLLWWLPLGLSFVMMRAGTRQGGTGYYLRVMLAVSFCVASFGLLNSYLSWESVGLLPKENYKQWLTGTFVNRNSAASFMVIGLTISVASMCQSFMTFKVHLRGHSTISQLTTLVTTSTTLYMLGSCFLLVAIFLTGSRAGVASGVLAITLVLCFMFRASFMAQKRKLFAFIGVISVVGSMAVNALMDRADDGTGSSAVRIVLAEEAIAAIADRPVFGHGAGTYQFIEPIYRKEASGKRYVFNHAHNTFLEAAASFGLPVMLLWLGVLVALLRQIYLGVLNQSQTPLATIVVFSLLLAEGLHALVDFSFEVQAIALYFAALLGLAIGEAMPHVQQRSAEGVRPLKLKAARNLNPN
jgi:O-antigen ligase